jgi:hypothetical protein
MAVLDSAPIARRTLDVVCRIALGFAIVWGVLLVAAAFVVPVGTSETAEATSSGVPGVVTTTTTTLVQSNGIWGAIVISIPLGFALLVAVALRQRRHVAAVVVAWVLTALVCVFTFLAMLSIGIFVLPLTMALVIACTMALVRPPAA